jgi:hypothetical protein
LWEGEGFRFHGVSKAGGGGVGNSADLGEVGSWMMVVVKSGVYFRMNGHG